METQSQHDALIAALEEAERAARGTRWSRLRRTPLRYLGATAYAHLWYRLDRRGYRTRAVTFFGATMEVLLPAAMDIFLLGAKTHDSEIRLTRFLLTTLQPGATFVDIGAHFGFFTLLAARLVGAQGQVVALEAGKSNFGLLAANVRNQPNIKAFHLAAADVHGEVTLYEYPPWHSEANTTLPPPSSPRGHHPTPIQVPAVRLDNFFKRQDIDPDIIKIDVEGAEAMVARGLSDWLPTAKNPLIAMEYLPSEGHSSPHQEALRLFREYGLLPHLIDSQGSLTPCPEVEDYLIQQNLDSENIVLKRTLN